MSELITVFKRRAWTRDKDYPGGWRPHVGRRTRVAVVDTIEQARRMCKEHNDARKSRGDPFMEFTSNY